MRMILVDHARANRALKRGGAAAAVTLDDCMAVSPGRAPDVLEVHEALDRLAAVDERKAKVIEMRYFGGMDREEVAAALGPTVATVKRDLRLGETWLRRFSRARTASEAPETWCLLFQRLQNITENRGSYLGHPPLKVGFLFPAC